MKQLADLLLNCCSFQWYAKDKPLLILQPQKLPEQSIRKRPESTKPGLDYTYKVRALSSVTFVTTRTVATLPLWRVSLTFYKLLINIQLCESISATIVILPIFNFHYNYLFLICKTVSTIESKTPHETIYFPGPVITILPLH